MYNVNMVNVQAYSEAKDTKQGDTKKRRLLISYIVYACLAIICLIMYLTRGFTSARVTFENNCSPMYYGCGTREWVVINLIIMIVCLLLDVGISIFSRHKINIILGIIVAILILILIPVVIDNAPVFGGPYLSPFIGLFPIDAYNW